MVICTSAAPYALNRTVVVRCAPVFADAVALMVVEPVLPVVCASSSQSASSLRLHCVASVVILSGRVPPVLLNVMVVGSVVVIYRCVAEACVTTTSTDFALPAVNIRVAVRVCKVLLFTVSVTVVWPPDPVVADVLSQSGAEFVMLHASASG